MPQTNANGVTLEYEVHGVGEPLLLVMGLGGQLVSWPAALIEAFVESGFQVVIFDNRDVGLSSQMKSKPPSPARFLAGLVIRRLLKAEYLLADMAADAVRLLDALGLARAHVVGISMGGMIAQTMAIDHPNRVLSLTSIMSTTGSRRVGRMAPSLLRKVPRLSNTTRETTVDKTVELFRLVSGDSFDASEARTFAELGLARSYTPHGTRRQAAAIFASPDRTDRLRTLDVPALVIHGLQDTLVQPSGGMATARAIPGARLLMFPDMGHNLPASRMEEIVSAIVVNTRRAETNLLRA